MKKSVIYLKMIFAFLCITFSLFTQCSTVAFATWETIMPTTENVENLIPDELTLDIKEIEYEKAEEEAKNKIINILKFNGILTDELQIDVALGGLYELNQNVTIDALKNETGIGIYKINVCITGENTNISKNITLTYSNTIGNVSADNPLLSEINLVKDLHFEERMQNLEIVDPYAFCLELKDEISAYYTPKFETDSSTKVVVEYEYKQIGVNIFNRYDLAIFKNDTLCEVKFLGSVMAVPIIDMPETEEMTEEEIENCISEKIQSCFPDIGNDIISTTSGWSNMESETDSEFNNTWKPYTLILRDSNGNMIENWILIRFANLASIVEETDENLVEDGVLVEELPDEDIDFYMYYDPPEENIEDIDTDALDTNNETISTDEDIEILDIQTENDANTETNDAVEIDTEVITNMVS